MHLQHLNLCTLTVMTVSSKSSGVPHGKRRNKGCEPTRQEGCFTCHCPREYTELETGLQFDTQLFLK